MPGTRVYADLAASESEVHFSLKNISEQPLNIPAEELTERFIRGDLSRSTEGSGLGLAVCRSIARAHGGDVNLFRAAEGFVARVTLPLAWDAEMALAA